MRVAQNQLESELASQLLLKLLSLKPPSFERFVIRLLMAMGYGGSTAKAARALGRS
jgi:restriction system protein